tara:strand:+ start:231 stop:770 length:540 start_codon:yes stop_codon:yes gene_type:complete
MLEIMGKRSNFKRIQRDFYPTPYEAVLPLIPHLPDKCLYDEPCCGDGDLIRHLTKHLHKCISSGDIKDGWNATDTEKCGGNYFITNPPWPAIGQQGEPTISIIKNLSSIAPTWLLLSADFAHNKYFSQVSKRCSKIVSVGRVRWIPDTSDRKSTPGKDNAAWYLFCIENQANTTFIGRA